MTDIRIRVANVRDIPDLIADMRREDRAEYEAIEPDMFVHLKTNLELSDRAWSVFINGELAGIVGVRSLCALGSVGEPWLCTTSAVSRYPKTFLSLAKAWVISLGNRYSRLVGTVDSRYTKSVKWLTHMGFTIRRDDGVEFSGIPFYVFERCQ